MIDYSINTYYAQVGDKTSDKFYAPIPQVRETLDIQKFAKHIAEHGSVYGRGDIAAVLTQAVDCIREMLLAGNAVNLGDLGQLAVTFKNELVKDKAEVSPVHIKKVKVRYTPGPGFEDLRSEAEFNFVPSRKAQAEAKKAIKGTTTSGSTNGSTTGGENGITGPTQGGLGA